jgi:nicotinamidase-related amidase
MAAFASDTALVLIDFINDIVDPKGKLAGKGYTKFDEEHSSLTVASDLLARARTNKSAVIHVRVGFSPDYKEQPEGSPLFGGAKKFNALCLGDWGTEFHTKVSPLANEAVLVKHRVSAFHGTCLEVVLRTYGVRTVVFAGCATDMAVQATARDAHDRDFACIIASDSCIAASDDDHEQTLRMITKVASVKKSEELFC